MGSRNYSTSVDIWSIGCIFSELINSKPLFQGTSEEDQLYKIFKLRGTPSPETWPGVQHLPYYKVRRTNIYRKSYLCMLEIH